MAARTFINLPTKDVAAAGCFAEGLGLTKKADWCNSNHSIAFAWGDHIIFFWHDYETFSKWLVPGRGIADPGSGTQSIMTLSMDSREHVDKAISSAIEGGGKKGPIMVPEEEQEKWGMYSRSVQDPDGHLFEIIHSTAQM
ncbi:hypothetical protein AJ80_04857 [Polytolypa hystricis UAMH7299]|uniref:VOC domain-containing protein n=1 Tax=Polytolypa hystricis (strain UAMH7299) TaxID=1447883 RepID=A0A2B7Y8M1_POLH7|nr:hypothetical protein AJ80_04857 [Polytolypa hystricis UAMH7299]